MHSSVIIRTRTIIENTHERQTTSFTATTLYPWLINISNVSMLYMYAYINIYSNVRICLNVFYHQKVIIF